MGRKDHCSREGKKVGTTGKKDIWVKGNREGKKQWSRQDNESWLYCEWYSVLPLQFSKLNLICSLGYCKIITPWPVSYFNSILFSTINNTLDCIHTFSLANNIKDQWQMLTKYCTIPALIQTQPIKLLGKCSEILMLSKFSETFSGTIMKGGQKGEILVKIRRIQEGRKILRNSKKKKKKKTKRKGKSKIED